MEGSIALRLGEGRSLDPAPRGKPRDAEGEALGKALAQAGATTVPWFSPEVLELSARVRKLHPKGAPDLSRYRRVVPLRGAPAPLAFETLAALVRPHREGVADAIYVSPTPELPSPKGTPPRRTSTRPPTPNLEPWQGYLDPPEAGGVGARRAWRLPGGDGAGVRIADVEESWNPGHEDLPPVTLCGGQPQGGWASRRWRHGTSVLGVLAARCDGRGVTGIAPCAELAFASVYATPDGAANEGDAIGRAAAFLRAGDVLLVEEVKPHPTLPRQGGGTGRIPVEWWPENGAVIRTATLAGILVVQPVGNTGNDLDDPRLDTALATFPSSWSNPFRRGAADPLSLLVGAGTPPHQGRLPGPLHAARSRWPASNFGSCVDAQGWGLDVATCGGDPPNLHAPSDDACYTSDFDGTSAAGALVAGVLACAQGMRRAAGRPLLTPKAARNLLRHTGQPQQDRPSASAVLQRIGSLPDLAALEP